MDVDVAIVEVEMRKKIIILLGACMLSLSACATTNIENEKSKQSTMSVSDNINKDSSSESVKTNTTVSSLDQAVSSNEENIKEMEIVGYYQKLIGNKAYAEGVRFLSDNFERIETTEIKELLLEDHILSLEIMKGYYLDLIRLNGYEMILIELSSPIQLESFQSISDEIVKSQLIEIYDLGFVILAKGEHIDIEIDYERLMNLSRSLEGSVRDFIELKYYEKAINDRLASGSAVNIDEFVAKIIEVENHLDRWPNSPFSQQINELYKKELMLYYMGNTYYQVFDYTTNRLKEQQLDLMKKHMLLYKDSGFANIGIKYLLELESNDYAYHPEYIQLIENYKRFGIRSNLKIVEKLESNAKVSIYIPELQGHENVTIQESINSIIRNEIEDIKIQTGYTSDSEGTFYFNTFIYTSNSKILSLECIGSHNMKDWTKDKAVSTTLNFDLATGEPLSLERLFEQETGVIDAWLLPLVNSEFERFFTEKSKLETLEGTKYIVLNEALLIIGKESTDRAYIPQWKLNEHVNWKNIVENN